MHATEVGARPRGRQAAALRTEPTNYGDAMTDKKQGRPAKRILTDQAAAVYERFAKECQPPKNVAIAYLSHSLSHTWVGLPVRSTRRAQPTGASALLLARGAAPSATPRQNRMSTMA